MLPPAKKNATENETIENRNIGYRRLVLAEVLNDKVGEEKKKSQLVENNRRKIKK